MLLRIELILRNRARMVAGEMRPTKPHLDGLAGHQPQGPVVVAVGDWAAGDGDPVCPLLAGECLASTFLELIGEHHVHTAVQEADAHPFDGAEADALHSPVCLQLSASLSSTWVRVRLLSHPV
jgi:hypothetical protein